MSNVASTASIKQTIPTSCIEITPDIHIPSVTQLKSLQAKNKFNSETAAVSHSNHSPP
jgi:hypothetical protein